MNGFHLFRKSIGYSTRTRSFFDSMLYFLFSVSWLISIANEYQFSSRQTPTFLDLIIISKFETKVIVFLFQRKLRILFFHKIKINGLHQWSGINIIFKHSKFQVAFVSVQWKKKFKATIIVEWSNEWNGHCSFGSFSVFLFEISALHLMLKVDIITGSSFLIVYIVFFFFASKTIPCIQLN